jgi:parallel beta-helix repeat protein
MTTYYIDPSAAVNGSGTAASPFNSWGSVTWAAGNTYLQKRNTTYIGTVTVGASGTSATAQIWLGSYYNSDGSDDTTQPLPKIVASGNGISVTFRNWVNVQNLDVTSTGASTSGIALAATNDCTVKNNNVTAVANGIQVSAASFSAANRASRRNLVDSNTITQTGTTAGNAAININGQYGATDQGVYDVQYLTVTNNVITQANYGIYGVSGGATAASSEINHIYIGYNTISNCRSAGGIYITPAANQAANFSTANAQCRDIQVVGNKITNCQNTCMSITSIGGFAAYNVCRDANTQYSGTTGNMQFIVQGYSIYNNVSFNASTSGADGVGIFLDINTAFTEKKTGSSQVDIYSNQVYGCHGSSSNSTLGNYVANYAPDYVTQPPAGIRTYCAKNVNIFGNYCYDNGVGIGVDGFSVNVNVFNNTLVNNYVAGVALSWCSGQNLVKNNLFHSNTYNILHSTVADKTTTGNITLSQSTIGNATCTSTAGDFATFSTNYGIREVGGTGIAVISSKQSSTQVTVQILSPFASTTYTTGNWKLTLGNSEDTNITANAYWNAGANALLGSTVTISAKGSDINSNPLVNNQYVPSTLSPLYHAGTFVSSNTRDATGIMFNNPPTIGGFEVPTTKNAR